MPFFKPTKCNKFYLQTLNFIKLLENLRNAILIKSLQSYFYKTIKIAEYF